MRVSWYRLAVALLIAVSTAAHAEWVRIGSTTNGRSFLMDADRIRTVGSKVQAWVQVDYSRDRSVSFRKGMELWSFDCRAQTMKVLSSVRYDAYGKVVSSSSEPDYGVGYEPIIPESIGDVVFSVACIPTTSSS